MENIEARVAELLGQMTLEEKIGLTIGQGLWSTNGVERLGIAPIALNDGPHGVRKPTEGYQVGIGSSLPATCFPPAAALAASWDVALADEVGRALADECLALDVQVLLGPGVNIKRTPLGGRNFEYYSEDPVLAGEMGAALVRGIQSKGIGTSLKHYACNNQEYERMTISVEIDERTLRELYLAAFERIVRTAQPTTIMSSYNKVNEVYASEHPHLLHDILKTEWGFAGVVMSDWGAVNEKDKALAAGLDLEMPGHAGDHDARIAALVRNGTLSEATIDDAARRMLTLILRSHATRTVGATFDKAEHHALARRAAAESIVLLKNDNDILPLTAATLTSVAVIGRFGKEPRFQGAGSSQIVPTQTDSTYDELQRALGDSVQVSYAEGYSDDTDGRADDVLHEAVEAAKAATIALVFVGLPDEYESEGWDRSHINLPDSHNRLVAAVCAAQPNSVIVLHNGSVVAMPWLAQPKAVIEASLGGQAIGGALADVITGVVNPSGKLAETYPMRLEDTPAYINYPGEAGKVNYGEGLFVGYRYYDKKRVTPLFPFGYGLSYTTFVYENIHTDSPILRDGDTLTVTATVRNSGKVAGKETVQLYVRAHDSRFVRPDKELKAFAKIALEPGESKDVTLRLEARDFQLWDSARNNWRLEGGKYEIVVGGSSAATTLSTTITVEEDLRAARPVFTRMSSFRQMLDDPTANAVLMQAFAGTPLMDFAQHGGEMMLSIPIIKATLFGMMTEEMVDGIVAMVNAAPVAP